METVTVAKNVHETDKHVLRMIICQRHWPEIVHHATVTEKDMSGHTACVTFLGPRLPPRLMWPKNGMCDRKTGGVTELGLRLPPRLM